MVPVDDYFDSDTGTRLVLNKLKEQVNARDVKRYLQQTMPLSPDFKIVIGGVGLSNEIELRSEDLLAGGHVHEFESEEETGVGKVTGRIAFLEHGIKESGVYIRVLKRLVNYGHPDNVIDFTDITHAMQFQRRVIVEINADGLNDVLLTNRSDFLRESEKWQVFLKWLKRTMQHYINIEYEGWQEKSKQFETERIPEATTDIIQSSLEGSKNSKRIFETLNEKMPKYGKRDVVRGSSAKYKLEGTKLRVVTRPLGHSLPEAIFDPRTQEIIINSNHPLYLNAKKYGKKWGIFYHSIKSSIIVIALEIAKDLKEFKELYDNMLLEAPDKLSEVRLRRNEKGNIVIRRR